MATSHICPRHPAKPGEWVDGTVARCEHHNHDGVPNVSPGIMRLRSENETGISSNDIEKNIIEEAKESGRDLHRPSDFGW
jgi:hypothetical protein